MVCCNWNRELLLSIELVLSRQAFSKRSSDPSNEGKKLSACNTVK